LESRKCRKRVVRNEVKEVKRTGSQKTLQSKERQHSKELTEEHRSNIVII